MPRLRSRVSGAVVNVSTETAALLDAEWQPADKAAPAKPAANKTAAKKAPAKARTRALEK